MAARALRGCAQLVGRETGRRLERINVLCKASAQEALVVEQPNEAVGRRGREVSRPELLAQSIKGRWVAREEAEVEDGLRVGKAVVEQVVVQASAGRAEVRDAGRHTDPSSTHDHDVRRSATLDQSRRPFQA